MKVWPVLLLIVFGFFSVTAQERYLRPVDEARADASFLAFRARLVRAVKARDASYILSIVDPHIKNSFGGNDGLAEFKKQWKIESPASRFWAEFLPVIANGGRFDSNGPAPLFTAPYSYSAFPGDLDAFEHAVIFGANVNLRARPAADGPIVGRLSYNLVKIVRGVEPADRTKKPEWYEIETFGGRKGFVKSDFVRYSIDYRAGFEKKKGRWRMIFFLAGD